MARNNSFGPVSSAAWERCWGKVGTRLFVEFMNAKDADAALAVWRQAGLLRVARHELAAALTDGDAAAMAELNPVNRDGAEPPATPREAVA